MTQRIAFFLAAALTVCVLIVGLGITLAFPGKHIATAAPAVAVVADSSTESTVAVQDMTNLMQQRDAQYRAEIEKANAQLKQAYDTIQTLQAQNQELQQREVVYQQRLGEAIQYIQFIQNQIMQGAGASAFAGERGDDHD